MSKKHEKDELICEQEEEDEEEYILLELDDCLYSEIPPNAPYILSGLDTLTPTLVVGDGLKMLFNHTSAILCALAPYTSYSCFIGEYEETVGTCYLFSESDARPKPIRDDRALAKENKDKQASSSKEGMKGAPPMEVKHLASVQKILKFRSINEDYQQHRAYQHKDKGF